jgi:hypothetical protein
MSIQFHNLTVEQFIKIQEWDGFDYVELTSLLFDIDYHEALMMCDKELPADYFDFINDVKKIDIEKRPKKIKIDSKTIKIPKNLFDESTFGQKSLLNKRINEIEKLAKKQVNDIESILSKLQVAANKHKKIEDVQNDLTSEEIEAINNFERIKEKEISKNVAYIAAIYLQGLYTGKGFESKEIDNFIKDKIYKLPIKDVYPVSFFLFKSYIGSELSKRKDYQESLILT